MSQGSMKKSCRCSQWVLGTAAPCFCTGKGVIFSQALH